MAMFQKKRDSCCNQAIAKALIGNVRSLTNAEGKQVAVKMEKPNAEPSSNPGSANQNG
jgi:hypothetical protein